MTAGPAEYATRPLPEELELCSRCKAGVVHRRGPAGSPYCPKCGSEAGGVRYVRAVDPEPQESAARPSVSDENHGAEVRP